MTKKEIQPDNINHIRLANGEEIFGHVEVLDDGIAVHTPLQTTEMEDDDGTVSVGLTSYLPFADENMCFFDNAHVITYNKVHPEIERFYFLSCHFTQRADGMRLADITNTNQQMTNRIFNQNFGDMANGAIVLEGPISIN